MWYIAGCIVVTNSPLWKWFFEKWHMVPQCHLTTFSPSNTGALISFLSPTKKFPWVNNQLRKEQLHFHSYFQAWFKLFVYWEGAECYEKRAEIFSFRSGATSYICMTLEKSFFICMFQFPYFEKTSKQAKNKTKKNKGSKKPRGEQCLTW